MAVRCHFGCIGLRLGVGEYTRLIGGRQSIVAHAAGPSTFNISQTYRDIRTIEVARCRVASRPLGAKWRMAAGGQTANGANPDGGNLIKVGAHSHVLLRFPIPPGTRLSSFASTVLISVIAYAASHRFPLDYGISEIPQRTEGKRHPCIDDYRRAHGLRGRVIFETRLFYS